MTPPLQEPDPDADGSARQAFADRGGPSEPRRPREPLAMQDHSSLTGWQLVCQAQALHPEWTLAEHLEHLRDAEGRDIDPIWVARWLRNIAADATS
jgi:hypothetical protein